MIDTRLVQGRTQTLSLKLDVQERLRNMQAWEADWRAEHELLNNIIDSADITDPQEVQRAYQAIVHQKRERLRIIPEPIEVVIDGDAAAQYESLNRHLRRQFARLSHEEREYWMMNFLFILTPDLRELTDKITRIRAYRSLGQQRNFLLGGKSGMGKTTCLDWLAITNRRRVEGDLNIIPIIKIDAPVSNKSAREMYQFLILEFGKFRLGRETEAKLLQTLTTLINQCRTEVIVIDEIEHLTTHHMRRHLLELSNHNRGVPIICASCHPNRFIVGDSEIKGRWNDEFTLAPYNGDKLRELLVFLDLLLPFPQLSDLEQGEIFTFIEERTDGILRDIMILITDTCIRAIYRDAPRLTIELLRESWADIQHREVMDFMDLKKGNKR